MAEVVGADPPDVTGDSAHGVGQTAWVDRLQQVVEGVHAKGIDGVLLVCGDEHHTRRSFEAVEHPGKINAVEAGHPHVEEDEIDSGLLQYPKRFCGVADGVDHRYRLLQTFQLSDQIATRRRLVVDHQHPDRISAHEAART
jgi:hypothetical protein